jgi:hypothetical protein
LSIFEHDETNTLVCRLLQHSWDHTLVDASESTITNDSLHSVEHISILGVLTQLIVNQLSLNGFLRSHNKDGFRGSSGKTAQEVVSLVSLGKDGGLHKCVCTEADLILGHGEQKKGAVTSVETKNTFLSKSLLNSSNHTKLVDFRVKLHNSLGILSGIGASDFNSTGHTT